MPDNQIGILWGISFDSTRIAYVAVSRAKTHAAIYTDDRLALVDAIEGRDGAKVGAIDETLARGKVAAIAIPATIKAGGMAIGG